MAEPVAPEHPGRAMLARWKSAPPHVWLVQAIWLVGVAVPAGLFLIALIMEPHPMVVVFSIPVLLHAALVVPPAIMLGAGAGWARIMLIVLGALNLVSTCYGNATVMLGRLWGLPLLFAATIVLLVLPSTRAFCGRPARV